jgi:hypothetical protein
MIRRALFAVAFVACDATPPAVAPQPETAQIPVTTFAPSAAPSPSATANAPAPIASAAPVASAAPAPSASALNDCPPDTACGNMFGDSIGDAFGAGGLGIGLDAGVAGDGGVRSSGRAPGSRIRQGAVEVNGRLPPEVIQRIVRQNFGRFRLCYESALRTKPKLAGTAVVRFVIDRAGAVMSTSDAGSTLPDASAVACIVRGFNALSYPQPEGGLVTVKFSLVLSPD